MKKGKKTPSLKNLKKEAWKEFSKYIRQKYANKRGYVVCVTCQKKLHWKKAQAGHFIAGRTNAILFDEELVFPQCVQCNVFLHGNEGRYYRFMIDRLGGGQRAIELIDELYAKSKQPKKYTATDLVEICEYYRGVRSLTPKEKE